MNEPAREIENLHLMVQSLREQFDSMKDRVKAVQIRGQLGGYSVIRRNEVLAALEKIPPVEAMP